MPTKQQRRANRARTQRRRQAQQRRHEIARRRGYSTDSPIETGRSRRPLWIGIAALVVVVGGVTSFLVLRDSTPVHHLQSPQVSSSSGDRAVTATPDTYKVVYRFETHVADGSVELFTEELSMRRPFEGRLLYRSDAPPGGDRYYEVVSQFGTSAQYSPGVDTGDTQIVPPDLALGEQRLDVTLERLVELGFYEPRERRQVAGRECVVYHTGSPIESRTITKANKTEYADICIDNAGLILEEVSVRQTKVATRLLAVEVSVDQPLDDTFTVPPPLPTARGTNQLIELDPAARPADSFFGLDAVPDGFEHVGRYHYLQDLSDPNAPSDTPKVDPLETYYDVYRMGRDVVIISQGKLQDETPISDSLSEPVVLDDHPEARVETGLNGFTIAIHPEEWYVHVYGTRPLDQLVTIANGLKS